MQRSSASKMRIHSKRVWSIAQFFCEAEPRYARWRKRTLAQPRAISGVPSVENESTTTISSHHSSEAMQSPTLCSSLKVVTTAEIVGRSSVRAWPASIPASGAASYTVGFRTGGLRRFECRPASRPAEVAGP